MQVVVLSPHLDDAVLSVGATISALTRRGVPVRVVTLFAGDPSRTGPPSYWDAQRGVDTAAAATAMRRQEDLAASEVLGYEPVWLSFDDSGYVYDRNPQKLMAAVDPHLADASAVLMPGWPLSQSDHRYTAMLMAEKATQIPLLLYSELPYGATPHAMLAARVKGRNSAALRGFFLDGLCWRASETSKSDQLAKRAAVGCYSGELQALGYRARLAAAYERLIGNELIGHGKSVDAPEIFQLR